VSYAISLSGTTVTIASPGPRGVGVPDGGTTGQTLQKSSGTDYDFAWANPADTTIPSLSSPAFLFADNTGYVEDSTVAFIRTEPLNAVYPMETPISFGGSGSGTDYSDKVLDGVIGAKFYLPQYQDLFPGNTVEVTGSVNLVDMTGNYSPLGPLTNVSVAFNNGTCIETLSSPHRDADSGYGLDTIRYNFLRVMRSHEAQACSAAIDAIATNGIDGGTF